MKDVEILLRGFALLIDGQNYAPSMVKFLNQFSRMCRGLEGPGGPRTTEKAHIPLGIRVALYGTASDSFLFSPMCRCSHAPSSRAWVAWSMAAA